MDGSAEAVTYTVIAAGTLNPKPFDAGLSTQIVKKPPCFFNGQKWGHRSMTPTKSAEHPLNQTDMHTPSVPS